jgi:uncharacterized protein
VSFPFKETPKGLFLQIKATPKAKHEAVEKWLEGPNGPELHVKVTAPADQGKANAAVISLLAKTCGVAKSCFELSSGETNRHKTIRIISREEDIAQALIDFVKKQS